MAQTFQKRPAGWHIAGRAWLSTVGAIISMLPLYVVLAGLLIGYDYSVVLIETKLIIIPPANNTLLNEMLTRDSWFFGLMWLGRVLILAPGALAAQRYILVDDGPRLAPGPLLRFMGWVVVLASFSLGSLYVSDRITTPSLLLSGMVLKAFAVAVPLLLLPVFPAVAANAPKDRSRIEIALQNWDGNLWRLVIAALLTVAPAVLLSGLPASIVARTGGEDAVQAYHDGLIGLSVDAVMMTAITVLVAVTLAWWYAWARQGKAANGPVSAAA